MSKVAPSTSPSPSLFSDGRRFSRASSSGLKQLGLKNPELRNSRRWMETAKVTILLVSPMILLLTMTIMAHVDALRTQEAASEVMYSIKTSLELAELVRLLQIERGRTSMYLSSNRSKSVYEVLIKNRKDTDHMSKLISDWSSIDISYLNASSPNLRGPNFNAMMATYRGQIDLGNVSVTNSLKFFSDLNQELIGRLFVGADAPEQYRHLVAFDAFARAGEYAGVQRAVGAAFWIPCDYIESNKLWLIETHSDHIAMLKASFRYFPPLKENYNRIIGSYDPLWKDIEKMVEYLISSDFRANCSFQKTAKRQQMGQDWFNNMTFYINTLSDVRSVLIGSLEESLDGLIISAQTKVILYSCVLIAVTFCAIATIYTVGSIFKMTAKLQEFATSISKKTKEVEAERKRTDALLSQMMPISVAEQLKANKPVEPEYFEDVTIYFSDIVGFTSISAQSNPNQIVNLLNSLYGMFDSTIDKYDVYKVETIGDAYMVASGLPIRNGMKHAAEIALLSLDLLDQLQDVTVPHIKDKRIMLRIGMHSGPCAAGVVGVKMPRYCLFGDTVNTASKMESSGEAMKVHVSETTRDRLSMKPHFMLDPRSTIDIKGQGQIKTYWLTSDLRFSSTPSNNGSRITLTPSIKNG